MGMRALARGIGFPHNHRLVWCRLPCILMDGGKKWLLPAQTRFHGKSSTYIVLLLLAPFLPSMVHLSQGRIGQCVALPGQDWLR